MCDRANGTEGNRAPKDRTRLVECIIVRDVNPSIDTARKARPRKALVTFGRGVVIEGELIKDDCVKV